MKKYLLDVTLVVLFFVAWYAIAHATAHNRFILPDPLAVLSSTLENWSVIQQHATCTFIEMILAIVLALGFSLPLSFVMYSFPKIGSSIQGLFLILKCLPSFALSPLIVLWIGFGKAAVLLPATLMLLFPLTIGLFRGLHAVPMALIELFQGWKATYMQIFLQLRIPYALPQFFSGLRVALSLLGTAVLAGEWVGSEEGLGYLLLEAKEGLNLSLTYAALAIIFLFSAFFYLMGTLIEKNVLTRLRLHSSAMIMIAAMLLVSCSEQTQKPTTLMLDWTPCPNHIPLIAGIQQGYFEREGIDLQIKTPGSQDALQLVAAGQVDACISHLPRVMRAVDQGADLVVIGVLVDQTLNGILTRGGVTLHDLHNARIGVQSKTGSKTCEALLSRINITPATWIRTSLDPVSAILANQVDAMWGVYENIEQVQLEYLGQDVRFIPIEKLGYPRSYELIVVAQRNNKLHTKLLGPFLAALQASIDFAYEKPDEAFAVYLSCFPGKSAGWEDRSWKKTAPLLCRQQQVSQAAFDKLAVWLKGANLIKVSPKYEMIAYPLRHEISAADARTLSFSDPSCKH